MADLEKGKWFRMETPESAGRGVQGIKEGRVTAETAALPSPPMFCQVVSHGDPYSWNLDGSKDFGIPCAGAGHKVQAELTIVLLFFTRSWPNVSVS